jgi:hypothetical protein
MQACDSMHTGLMEYGCKQIKADKAHYVLYYVLLQNNPSSAKPVVLVRILHFSALPPPAPVPRKRSHHLELVLHGGLHRRMVFLTGH